MSAALLALLNANKEIDRLTRERDAAIAQRDRAVAGLSGLQELSTAACQDEWTAYPFPNDDGGTPYCWFIEGDGGNLGMDFDEPDARFAAACVNYVRGLLSNTPVLERLAAEREAGRRKGLEEAAKVADGASRRPYDPLDGGAAIIRETAWWIAAAVRNLHDTPAAPETGKTEGGNTSEPS